jgi:hypothetical protein
VVQRQVALAATAAVLAREVVAVEHLAPGQPHLRPGALDQVDQPDDGRQVEGVVRRAQEARRMLEDFRFAALDQNERAADVADVQRLVVLIQDQDGRI